MAAEMLTCGLLGRLLISTPQADWLLSLAKEDVFSEIPLGMENPDVIQGSALMQNWTQKYLQDSSGSQRAALEDDYTRLFIGPGKVLAPPWESVYKTKERLLFQEHTLEVRNWYRRFGLESETIYQEPDDHIGLELIFIAHLASLGWNAAESQADDDLNELILAQWQFLQGHPIGWAHLWCTDVLEFGRTEFHRGIAYLVKGVLSELQTTFASYFGAQ